MPRKNLIIFFAVLITLALGVSRAFSEDKYLKEMRTFSKILTLVLDNYAKEVPSDQLFEGAYRGMLGTLDPYSQYFTQKENEIFSADTRGEFGGIGIEISITDGLLTVVSPIRGTPAFQAGILPGDVILKVDDKSTERITSEDAVNMLRGKPGTKVNLTIRHRGSPLDINLTLTREVIKPVIVEYEMIDPDNGIAFMRISSFSETVMKDMREAVKKDLDEKKLKGLILDLRENPGGLLDVAVDMCDEFVAAGDIVSVRNRHLELNTVSKAKAGGALEDMPLVLLVDEGSASASEIVAGCMKDQKRAMLVGGRTFGKGSVQNVYSLGGGQAIKLTVAHYYTPSGKPILDHEGIMPNIYMPMTRDQMIALRGQEREDKLRGSYRLGGLLDEAAETAEPAKPGETRRSRIVDYQLKAALEVLRLECATKATATAARN